ncbi:UDP-D-xylose:L-fucose alpha-1,3-D-xylosyltransferase 3 [Holothuria leucospilota]|uniref:UDP-D-xylose:L-fucose alpha-1,3-D-xylosyltransferase 3 n=1 Tax=Holothuria leucospilota TaxID=206669 RepID=A0A9Q1CPL8_HOLLE|nr:UDP-D-xylose:L-fucose alpha-1,3-D-xylosyltransferase 3 [Holothuria leucospilota]
MLTATNKDFINITENFLEGLRRLRVRYNITLMAEDEEAYNYFSRRSNSEFHVVSSNQFILPGKLNRNISSYQHLIRRRTVYILTLLRSGRDVLLVDVDAVWLKDPLALIFPDYQKFDAWIAQGKEPGFPCPCFFYMKSVTRMINMVYDWIARVSYFEDGRPVTDQVALFNILEKNRRGVHIKYLDYERFPIGKQYFNWTWHKENHNSVYVAHGNHLGREQGKIETFKEFGVWLLDI